MKTLLEEVADIKAKDSLAIERRTMGVFVTMGDVSLSICNFDGTITFFPPCNIEPFVCNKTKLTKHLDKLLQEKS